MIDIHCHILPGLDDGAESLDDMLAMAAIAAQSGVTVLAATPHSNQPDGYGNEESDALRDCFAAARAALREAEIPLRLVRGMEIWGGENVPEKIAQHRLLALNGSRYYLVEFDFGESPDYITDALDDMLRHGFWPVLAHPERYGCVQEMPPLLLRWGEMGVLAQINKGSPFGRFGSRAQRAAELLLRHRLVHCVASDAHRPYARTPDMSKISDYLCTHFSPSYRDLLLMELPGRILANQPCAGMLRPIPFERRVFRMKP